MTKRRIAVLEEACKASSCCQRGQRVQLLSCFTIHTNASRRRGFCFVTALVLPSQAAEARAAQAEESLEVIMHAASGK
jgi:hypothetical protein